jgi:hypothetical protein
MRPHPQSAAPHAIALLAIAVFAARCGSSTSTSTAPSTVPRCAITLNSNDMSVPAAGGSGVVSVTATRDCTWSASVEGSWLTVRNGANGQGEGAIEFTAAANPDPQTRTGAIVVNASRAQITQAAGECVIRLATSSADFPPEGGIARIDVQASSALCTWTATADESWIQITSSTTGRGSAPVTISVGATTGPPRAGTVTIAGQRFSVTQSQGCTYAVDRTGHNASANGGAGTVVVATAQGCPWTAASNVPWMTVNPPAGTGPGPVTYAVAPTDGPQRTGTAVIAGQLFTVVQSPGCAFQVTPTTHSVGAAGGSASVSVNTANGCEWTAASNNPPWITIQGPSSGTGPGNLTFSVSPTTGPGRSGSLTVAGHQVSVSQSQGCTYSISPQSENVPSNGGGGKVTVTAGEGCAWTASKSVDWVTITSGASGSGNGEVQFTVLGTTGPARSTTLTIAGHAFTISQGQGCTFRLSPSSLNVEDEGGRRSFDVQTAAGCEWRASTTTQWIAIDSGSTTGSGTGPVRFTVAANSGPGRSGTITAGGQTFTVNQGTGCTFRLSPSSVNIENGGGQRSFEVQTASGCAWKAETSTEWIRINSGASGSGNGTVEFTAATNSGPNRTGTITAGGQTFTVSQGTGCTYSLSAESHNAPVGGGAGSVNVITANGCSWSATSNALPWLTITSGTTGSGNGPVGFSVAPNNGGGRSGTLTVAGRTFTVNQGEACTYSISPAQHSMPGAGGIVDVTVTAPGGCGWTAESQALWIAVTSGASGSGNGTVRLTVEQNAGASRRGTVTIAGRAFTVEQGSSCTYSIAPTSQPIAAAGGPVTVNVTAPDSCTWTAKSNALWIAVISGSTGAGNGPVQLNVDPNSAGARTGTVTVAEQTFTVTQEGGCTYSIAPTSQPVPAQGGPITVNVTAPGSCAWTAKSNALWIAVTSGSTGAGNGPVQLNVEPNSAGARTGTVTVAEQTFTVTQEGGCAFTVAPETINAPAAAATARVDISASGSGGCSWTVRSNALWITAMPASGNGGGNVELSIAANTGPPRSGTVLVAERTVTVNQQSGCTVAINPASQAIPAMGGTGTVTVTAGLGCQWTAERTVPWIAVTAGASGSGDGAVQFAVDPNMTGAPRAGTIVIGGQTFTVNQQ